MRKALFSSAIIAILMTIFIRAALADVTEAKDHFKKGVALFKDSDYEGALVEFEAAYEAQPNYEVKYNIGTSLHKLHRYVEAKKELEAYLSEGGEGITEEDKLAVQAILYEIQSLIGSITVTCSVKGSHVIVNDEDVGPCPFTQPLEVNLGEHDIEVLAEGYKPYKKTVTVTGGKAIIVNVDLETTAKPAPQPAPKKAVKDVAKPTPKPKKDHLTVLESSGYYVSLQVYIDGVRSGKTPLISVDVEPGEHKVAVVAKSSLRVAPYYETVHVGANQTVQVSAKMKKIVSRQIIVFGLTWLGIGGFATLTAGVCYGLPPAPNETTEKRNTFKNVTIGFASLTGASLILTFIGIGLYASYIKKDRKLKEEYLITPDSKLSLSPFAAPIDGGGVLGLTGVF